MAENKETWKDLSRIEWWNQNRPTTTDGVVQLVNTGCMQRIADATELMAKNHAQLIADRDMYERWYRERGAKIERLERANAALRGHLKRAKRKAVGNG